MLKVREKAGFPEIIKNTFRPFRNLISCQDVAVTFPSPKMASHYFRLLYILSSRLRSMTMSDVQYGRLLTYFECITALIVNPNGINWQKVGEPC